MQYLPTGDQMRRADQYTITKLGISSLVLMERAALQVVAAMEEEGLDLSKPLIVCGTGNNGGDGYAIARILKEKGIHAHVLSLGEDGQGSAENLIQKEIALKMGVSISTRICEQEYTVLIDAIFGTGLSRAVEGRYRETIQQINKMSAVKVAVDIPSGVSDTDGRIWGVCVQADYTVSLAFQKRGTMFYPGRSCCGKLITKPIGIGACALPKEQMTYTLDKADMRQMLPKREENTNKGSFGKALLIVGSKGMSGAAYLSAKAAYAAGAGLVHIYTVEENRTILQGLLPEAILTTYDSCEPNELRRLLDRADVVSVGSGLSTSDTAERILNEVIQYRKSRAIPMVLDGDGLNILSRHKEWLGELSGVVLTPHMKEMERLTGIVVSELAEQKISVLQQFLQVFPGVCTWKDARTIVAQGEKDLYINPTGNAAMAKAGSGDVLAGVITGLLAQKTELYEAAVLGVFLHGMAGDSARKRKGKYSVLASDLIDSIGEGMKDEDL